MPRKIRLQFPGAHYHVHAAGHGDRRIVRDHTDRSVFLETLAEACGKNGWRVHAYALLDDAYHLALETPHPNLVNGMKWLQTTYTARFNARHDGRGHVFGDRYKSVPVQHDHGDYFPTLLDYIHLAPVRAGLLRPRQRLTSYPWTSLAYYSLPPSKRQPWQVATAGLAAAGFPDTPTGRKKYFDHLTSLAKSTSHEDAGLPEIEGQSLQSTLQRGWYFGTPEFRKKLLALTDKTLTKQRADPGYSGPALRNHGLAHARDIIARGLTELQLTRADLPHLPKSDWRKALIALVVKNETSADLKWITAQLKMGTSSGVSRTAANIAARLKSKREKTLKAHYKNIATP